MFDVVVVVGGIPFCVSKYAANAEVHIKSPLLCLFSFYILSCLHRDDDERGSSFSIFSFFQVNLSWFWSIADSFSSISFDF